MKKSAANRRSTVEREIEAALKPVRRAREALMRDVGGTIEGLVQRMKEADRLRRAEGGTTLAPKPRRRRSA